MELSIYKVTQAEAVADVGMQALRDFAREAGVMQSSEALVFVAVASQDGSLQAMGFVAKSTRGFVLALRSDGPWRQSMLNAAVSQLCSMALMAPQVLDAMDDGRASSDVLHVVVASGDAGAVLAAESLGAQHLEIADGKPGLPMTGSASAKVLMRRATDILAANMGRVQFDAACTADDFESER